MAKAVKIPSLEEMREYLKEYSADPLHNRIYDADHAAMHKEMTLRIFGRYAGRCENYGLEIL